MAESLLAGLNFVSGICKLKPKKLKTYVTRNMGLRHCGTRCRSLFVTQLWQWRSSAHIWRLFCFAEHCTYYLT